MEKLCEDEVRWMIRKYKIETRKQYKRHLLLQRLIKSYFPFRNIYTSPSLRMYEINLDVTESFYRSMRKA